MGPGEEPEDPFWAGFSAQGGGRGPGRPRRGRARPGGKTEEERGGAGAEAEAESTTAKIMIKKRFALQTWASFRAKS